MTNCGRRTDKKRIIAERPEGGPKNSPNCNHDQNYPPDLFLLTPACKEALIT
jgi:hypothetical protein